MVNTDNKFNILFHKHLWMMKIRKKLLRLTKVKADFSFSYALLIVRERGQWHLLSDIGTLSGRHIQSKWLKIS